MIIVISITLFFIVLRFTVTLFNFISNPKLTRVNRHYTEFVSILIPARNEADHILRLLQSILAQDYKYYEVIVYDDESTDDTYSLCAALEAAHPNVSIIKGGELPAGWTGKNYACHQLAKKAKGACFLYLDANTTISNGLINSAVNRMQRYKLSLLSLFPNQEMPTFGEKATVPLLHYLLLNLLPLRLVFLTKTPAVAVAFGKLMLFDANIYRKNEWHSLVKNSVVEDTEIMKQVKQAGYNGEVLLANGMFTCRMYKNYNLAIEGFSKNALAAFNYSIAAMLGYLLFLLGGPMIVITTLDLNLIFFITGLIILTRIMIALAAGQKVWYSILLHPVQMVNLAIIGFLSIQKHLTKNIVWKGRRV